jgi:hypothetical protein
MHCDNEPGMPDCSPIGTVFVSRPRKLDNGRTTARLRICWEPMRDRTGLPGGNTTPTQDGMIAECQRANAEPRRQRDTALARRGSDYTDRLTAAVRDGRPGYRCIGSNISGQGRGREGLESAQTRQSTGMEDRRLATLEGPKRGTVE